MLKFQRSWTVALDGVPHAIAVEYAAIFGWMSIYVDGTRAARAWREVQTVLNGAVVACSIGNHRIEARITQPFGRQEFAFALRVDGVLQEGSDDQPEPRALKRQTVKALVGIAVVVAVFTTAAQLAAR